MKDRTCHLCGAQTGDFAHGSGWYSGPATDGRTVALCHPNDESLPDCYTLFTHRSNVTKMSTQSDGTDDPTVIVNEADLQGLRMPGDYEVAFDRDAGTVTIVSGPEKGKVLYPADRVIDAMREAQPGEVVMDTVKRYEDAADE